MKRQLRDWLRQADWSMHDSCSANSLLGVCHWIGSVQAWLDQEDVMRRQLRDWLRQADWSMHDCCPANSLLGACTQ
jgi:hypothetical protein